MSHNSHKQFGSIVEDYGLESGSFKTGRRPEIIHPSTRKSLEAVSSAFRRGARSLTEAMKMSGRSMHTTRRVYKLILSAGIEVEVGNHRQVKSKERRENEEKRRVARGKA